MKVRYERTVRWVAIRHHDPEVLDRMMLVPTLYLGTDRRPAKSDVLNNRMRDRMWDEKQKAKQAARLEAEYAKEPR